MGSIIDRLMAQNQPQSNVQQGGSGSIMDRLNAGGGDNSSPAVSIPNPASNLPTEPATTTAPLGNNNPPQPPTAPAESDPAPTYVQDDGTRSALKSFTFNAIDSALEPFKGLANHAAKYFPSLSGLAKEFNDTSQQLETASYDPNASFGSKAAGVAGKVVGSIAGTGPLFEGALGLTKLGASAFEAVTPMLAARVTAKIASAAEYTEGIAAQVTNAKVAAVAGHAVEALPRNLIAGLGMQAGIDPDSLKTPVGLATGIGFAGMGAILEGVANRNIPVNSAAHAPYFNKNLSQDENMLLGGMKVTSNVDVPDVQKARDKFMADFVDKFHGATVFERNVRNLPTNPGLPVGMLPSEMLALSNGSSGVADAILRRQVFYPDYATGQMIPAPHVDPLSKILADLAPDKDSQDKVRALMAARRITDPRIQAGGVNGGQVDLPPGWDLNTARRVIANADPNISAAVDQITNFSKEGVRKFGEFAGVINPLGAQVFDIESPNYFPMFRDVEKMVDPTLKPIDNTFGPGRVIQRMFGSEKNVLDPIQNIVTQTHIVTKAAGRNAIGQKILNIALNLSDSEQEAIGVKVLGPADKYSNPALYEMADKLESAYTMKTMGIDALLNPDEKLPVLRRADFVEFAAMFGKQYDETGNILTVQNGAKGLTRIQLSPELAQMYKYMSPQQTPFVIRLLGLPAKALTIGTTAAMDFSLANSLRDNFDAMLQSKYGFKLGIDSWKGFLEAIGKGKYGGSMKAEWLAAGGGEAAPNRAGQLFDNGAFNSVLPQNAVQKAITVFAHPIQAMYHVTRPLYEAAPLGEYMLGREQGASAMEAALASRSVVTDWARRGGHPVMQALSQMTSFLNPSVQYLDRNLRNFASNPGGTAIKGIAGITMPSALLWAASHGSLWGGQDDDDVNNLRRTETGISNWYFRLPNGSIAKLPKPFLYGQVFGTTIEAALDKMYTNDPNTTKRLVNGLLEQSTLHMVPNSIMLPFQMKANFDMNSGNAIVPDRLAHLDPQAQVLPGTSELAKYVSSYLYGISDGKVNVSPIHLDWLGKQTLGSTGRNIEVASGQSVAATLADKPFIHRFLATYPSMDVEPIQTFYDNADKANQVAQTIDYYGKIGDVTKLNAYLNRHASQLATSSIYAETQKQLGDILTTMHQIDGLKQFSPESKRNMNDYLIKQMILITSTVNKVAPDANDPDEILH